MRIFFFPIFLISSLAINAQHTILSGFSGFQVGNRVHIKCTVKQGNQCLGIDIYRSSDGFDYEKIGRIPGVCGDPSTDLQYQYIDSQPLVNTTNYYRVEPGNLGLSSSIGVEFYNTLQTEYAILDNFKIGQTKIIFNNPSKEIFYMEAYSVLGRLVYKGETRDRYFVINKQEINSKIIVFAITNKEDTYIKGKLLLH